MPNLNELNNVLGVKSDMADLCTALLKYQDKIPVRVQGRIASQLKKTLKEQKKQLQDKAKKPKPKKRTKPIRVSDYAAELQGLPSNKYGGNQLNSFKGYGNSYGVASKGRSLSETELAAAAKAMGVRYKSGNDGS